MPELAQSDARLEALKQEARSLAASVEESRHETLVRAEQEATSRCEQLERRVQERTVQLEAANRELEFFTYSVSHDLRTPLRAIDGFSRIVLEDYAAALPDDVKAYLRRVRDNTRQMGRLVDDLRTFSRLACQGLNKTAVAVDKLVRLCLDELQAERDGRDLDVTVGDLPPCHGDPAMLKQVWTNLLSNAVKFTRKRDCGRVTVGCWYQPGPPGAATEAVYFVADNGAGFDMRYADNLFGAFQRLHRPVDFDGTGMGLAIVQRIVHRHGGRAWGEARPNEGATFSFTLAPGATHD